MRYIDRHPGPFVDRHVEQPNLESIDVIMNTLDADAFLERALLSIYKEIPVKRLIVNDGGSKDNTAKIFQKFPRVEVHVRPDFRTFAKGLEFILSLVETEWFSIMDSDIELAEGWYDEMCKYKDSGDVLEDSKRSLAYHYCIEDKAKLEENTRPLDWTQLVRKSAVKRFHCEDDFMWRNTDTMFRQVVEKSGFKYKKIKTTEHLHHVTEGALYDSDKEKNYQYVKFRPPEYVIVDKEKERKWRKKNMMGVVKYLDPNGSCIILEQYSSLITLLDREWIKKNGPAWLEVYDRFSRPDKKIKNFIRKVSKIT